jgi:hypothetical protein
MGKEFNCFLFPFSRRIERQEAQQAQQAREQVDLLRLETFSLAFTSSWCSWTDREKRPKKRKKKTTTSNCECSAGPFCGRTSDRGKRTHRQKEMTEKGAEQTCDAKLVLLGNSGTRRPFLPRTHVSACGSLRDAVRDAARAKEKTKKKREKKN